MIIVITQKNSKRLIKELDSFTIFDNLFNDEQLNNSNDNLINDELIDDMIVEVDEINDDIDFSYWIDIDDDELDFINYNFINHT